MLRYSKKYIYYQILIISIFSFFFAFTFSSPSAEEEIWTRFNTYLFIGLTIIFITLGALYTYLFWRFSWYEFTNEAIIWKRGVIFKQRTILPYNKIHAVDYKQNIIQRLFKIKVLSVDSGATTKASIVEVLIVSDNNKIIELEKLIRQKMDNKEELLEEAKEDKENLIYKFSGKLKAMFSIFNGLLAMFVLFLGVLIITIVIVLLPIKELNIFQFILVVLGIIIASWVVMFLFSLLYAGLRYFNYQVSKKDNYLLIQYGILTKLSHTINLNKIKAVKVEEGFIERLFKMASIKIEVVGYGENSNQSNQSVNNVYIPLCKLKDVDKYLNVFPKSMQMNLEKEKAPSRSIRFFFGLKIFISSTLLIAFLPLIFLLSDKSPDFHALCKIYLVTAFTLYGLIIWQSLLAYKNAGITICEDRVIVHRGSFIKKHIIIPNNNIIVIEKKTTYLRDKENLTSYIIHYYNDSTKNTEKCSLLDADLYVSLIKNLYL